MKSILLASALALGAQSASAVEVVECSELSRADAIIEPWEQHIRTFANGAVRIAALDLIEPAAGASWLMVLSPPHDELGARQCRMIGFDKGIGFAAIYFSDIEATYDPAKGLTLAIPTQIYLPEENFTNSVLVYATIDQATGQIDIETQLGRE